MIVAAVVLSSVIVIYVMGQAVIRSSERISHAEMIVRHLHDTTSAVKDAETGQRGFLLTGDERYLTPYVSSQESIAKGMVALEGYAADDGLAKDDVARLKTLINEKLKELDETIQLRREKGFDAALGVVKTDAGKRYMDELRSLTRTILDHEADHLAELKRTTNLLTLGRTVIFIVVAATNLAFLFWAYQRLAKELRANERATAELNSQRELLRVTLESIGDGVIVTDAEARITFMNDVAMKLSGWSIDEAAGRNCAEVFNIVNEDTRRLVESPVDKVLRLGTVVGLANHTLLLRRDGTELPIDDSGAPIRDASSRIRGVVLVFRDFSDHKAASAKLISAREEAEAANIAKDNFLATLSHELRTPLTPVAATLVSWETHEHLPADMLADVHMMRRNVDLEARLIDDLLDLTRIVRGKLSLNLEIADLHALVSGVSGMYQTELLTKRLKVTSTLTAPRHFVHADPARLQQVLLNVLRNATKFTAESGSVEITTFNDASGRICLTVKDTGIGMSPEFLSRLFRPFEQGTAETVRRYGGLGLGMSISKALMEAQGGSIAAQSEGLGKGSTFTITLPTTIAPALSAVTPRPVPKTPVARELKILIVEDHADTARVMSRLLEKQGHRVSVAGTVAEAKSSFDAAPFDLLLSDIGLPDGTGIDVIRHVRALSAIPAIALTGYGMEEDVAKCRDAGFTEHLTKPVNFQRLELAIARITTAPK